MSANVDLVRSLYADWARGDFSSAEWAHPDIEFVIADGPDAGTLKGVPAMAAVWREFLTAWSGYGIQPETYHELDEERVLVILHAVGRGRTSGIDLGRGSEKGANLFTLSAGKVTRLAIYFDHTRALADLGLAE